MCLYIYIHICVCEYVCIPKPCERFLEASECIASGRFLATRRRSGHRGFETHFFGRRLAPAVILILLGFRVQGKVWGGVLWLQACSGIYPHPEGLL